MPRNTRNFWLTLNVDGRATPIETGPAAADGGFDLTVLMREDGAISDTRLRLRGHALYDGTLVLDVSVDGHPESSIRLRTNR